MDTLTDTETIPINIKLDFYRDDETWDPEDNTTDLHGNASGTWLGVPLTGSKVADALYDAVPDDIRCLIAGNGWDCACPITSVEIKLPIRQTSIQSLIILGTTKRFRLPQARTPFDHGLLTEKHFIELVSIGLALRICKKIRQKSYYRYKIYYSNFKC